jgi:hypothetical protein
MPPRIEPFQTPDIMNSANKALYMRTMMDQIRNSAVRSQTEEQAAQTEMQRVQLEVNKAKAKEAIEVNEFA